MKELTKNKLINEYLATNIQLEDECDDDILGENIFTSILVHEYDCGRLSYDELSSILYEVFHIDKNFGTYSKDTMNQLAALGFEIDQILNSDFEDPQCMLARMYLYLDILKDSDNEDVKWAAKKSIGKLNQISACSNVIQKIFKGLAHRECKFFYVDEHSCELGFFNSYYWSYGDEGIIFKITENHGAYDLYTEFIEPIYSTLDENNEIHKDFLKYNVEYDYDHENDIVCMRKSKMPLDELIRFVKFMGLELSFGMYYGD